MNTERAKRKLSAIFSADVKGYSRLMEEDEVGTVRTLKDYRDLMSQLIEEYRGRLVDSPGDNVLAEFASVVDALECSIEIQRQLKTRNAALPDTRKMQFRIGINLGDVIEDQDRLYGDGVNIAARIESLAEPGGICISGGGFDQVRNKLELGYQYLGEHTVKNIVQPIRVYRVIMEPGHARKVIGEKGARRTRWHWISPAVAVLILVAGGLAWNYYLRGQMMELASKEKMAFPLPDRPSIAVLPFVNMSDDPQQEYFSDGMTEDLITDLSKISGLFVIARNSVFQYKGKPVDVKRISFELGVRYVLEGSVRRVHDKIRINAQLIDSTSGGHLWAERYDGSIEDVFALQDRITGKIVAALAVKLTEGEAAQLAHKGTGNMAAYDMFLQGWANYVRFNPDDFANAVPYFEKAIELDPEYSRAHAALASIYWESFYLFWHETLGIPWEQANDRANKYINAAMKDPTPLSLLVSSKMLIASSRHEEALETAERAISLDPNDPSSHLAMAYALIFAGSPSEAIDFLAFAMRLDPQYPPFYLFVHGMAYFGMDRFEEAATQFERALARNPENYVPMIPLASTYGHLDRLERAASTVQNLKQMLPVVTLSFLKGCPLWKYKHPSDKERLLQGIQKAGLQDSIYDILRQSNPSAG
jgi:adenylate cyclase